jgi:hypothetical protein
LQQSRIIWRALSDQFSSVDRPDRNFALRALRAWWTSFVFAAAGGAAKRYGRKCRVVTQACRIEHIANAKHPHARLHGASESSNALATADSSTERVQIGDRLSCPLHWIRQRNRRYRLPAAQTKRHGLYCTQESSSIREIDGAATKRTCPPVVHLKNKSCLQHFKFFIR